MAATGLSVDWEDKRENDKASSHEDDAMSSRDEQQVDDLVQLDDNEQSGPDEEGPQQLRLMRNKINRFIMECTSSEHHITLVDVHGNKFQTQKAFNYKNLDAQL